MRFAAAHKLVTYLLVLAALAGGDSPSTGPEVLTRALEGLAEEIKRRGRKRLAQANKKTGTRSK
jgi:hypothetical protein